MAYSVSPISGGETEEELARRKVLERRRRYQLPANPVTGDEIVNSIGKVLGDIATIEPHARHQDVVNNKPSPIPLGPDYEPDKIVVPIPEETKPKTKEDSKKRSSYVKKKLSAKKLKKTTPKKPDYNANLKQVTVDDLKEDVLLEKQDADKAESERLKDRETYGQYAKLFADILATKEEEQRRHDNRHNNARAEIGGLSPVQYSSDHIRRAGNAFADLTANERKEYIQKKLQEKAEAKDAARYADKRKDREDDVAFREKQFKANSDYRAKALRAAQAKASQKAANKPLTQDQAKASGFHLRMTEANEKIRLLEKQGFNRSDLSSSAQMQLPNMLQSSLQQQWEQAEADWISANLRKESGAVIGAEEMAKEGNKYFPRAGDSAATIEAKRKSRLAAERAMAQASGHGVIAPARPQPTQLDQEALKWAIANPNDPRAVKIIEKVKATYGQ